MNRGKGRRTNEVALLPLFSSPRRKRDRHGADLEELAESVRPRSKHLHARLSDRHTTSRLE